MIASGRCIGILYYRYNSKAKKWEVGVHNGISRSTITATTKDIPVGHVSGQNDLHTETIHFYNSLSDYQAARKKNPSAAFGVKIKINETKPASTKPCISFRRPNGDVHNGKFKSFHVNGKVLTKLSDVRKLSASDLKKGTLFYYHYNLKAQKSGRFQFVEQSPSSKIVSIKELK